MRIDFEYFGWKNKAIVKFSNGKEFNCYFQNIFMEINIQDLSPLCDLLSKHKYKWGIKNSLMIFTNNKLTYLSDSDDIIGDIDIRDIFPMQDGKIIFDFGYKCLHEWFVQTAYIPMYQLRESFQWVEISIDDITIRFNYIVDVIQDCLIQRYPSICPQKIKIKKYLSSINSEHTMQYGFMDKDQKLIYAIHFELVPGTYAPHLSVMFPSIQVE